MQCHNSTKVVRTCLLLEKPCICHRALEERAADGTVAARPPVSAGGATSFMPLPTSSVPAAAFFLRCRRCFGFAAPAKEMICEARASASGLQRA